MNATPVAERSPALPNTIWTTLTAVPIESGIRLSSPVDRGARVLPRAEDRLDGSEQLGPGVLRELAPELDSR